MKTVGFLYNPERSNALVLADQLAHLAEREGWKTWQSPSMDPAELIRHVDSLQLLVTLGGDGTILRAARTIGLTGVPIVGVNLGRLGFLTEVSAEMAGDTLSRLLNGEGWLESRAMLSISLYQNGIVPVTDNSVSVVSEAQPSTQFVALNDITISRGEHCRMIQLTTSIDGNNLTTFHADGAIVSTATGSTAYSLSAGGPILYPQMDDLVFTPLMTHLQLTPPMVIPGTSKIQFQVCSDHVAMLNIDGQIDVRLNNGAIITVGLAEQRVQFLRSQSPAYFYRALADRLRW